MSKELSKPGIWWAIATLSVALSALGLWTERAQEARASEDATADAAVQWVRAGFQEGDAVCVLPTWDDGPWDGLRGAGPGAEPGDADTRRA